MFLQGNKHGCAAACDQNGPCPDTPSGAACPAGAHNTGALPRPGPKIPALGCSKCRHSSKGCKKCRNEQAEALQVRCPVHQQALPHGMLYVMLLAWKARQQTHCCIEPHSPGTEFACVLYPALCLLCIVCKVYDQALCTTAASVALLHIAYGCCTQPICPSFHDPVQAGWVLL